MFTNPSSAPNTVTATAPSTTSSSSRPSRTDRIRTLSLLRGYRQSHSHLFSHSADGPPAQAAPADSNVVSEPISVSTTVPLETSNIAEDSPSTAVEKSPEIQGTRGSSGRWLQQVAQVGSGSGASRSSVQAQATLPSGVAASPSGGEATALSLNPDSSTSMARTRAASTNPSSYRGLIPTYTAAALDFARLDRGSSNNASTNAATPTRNQDRASPTADATSTTSPSGGHSQMPSIRFVPHHDVRSTRPSLQFQSVSRVVSNEGSVIKVGRYSEREEKAAGNRDGNNGTSGPVGFKSKVVSRRHCEFWCANGQWYIKDVRSSSGTFLNHIRLSQPNVESRPFPVNDGDVVQLGIDFKGGEEMIFRCVKIRVECNRGWQKSLNNFNMATHKNLRSMAKTGTKTNTKNGGGLKGDTASTHSTECSICLFPIAPCQCLFVAPCSHVWHFKCIRPILNGPTFPQFLCPNCRALSDLEAEVDEVIEAPEDWEEDLVEEEAEAPKPQDNVDVKTSGSDEAPRQAPFLIGQPISTSSADLANEHSNSHQDLAAAIEAIALRDDPVLLYSTNRRTASQAPSVESGGNSSGPKHSFDEDDQNVSVSSTDHPNGIPIRSANPRLGSNQDGLNAEGPTTPRNDAGPFVFDGSGGLITESTTPRNQPATTAD